MSGEARAAAAALIADGFRVWPVCRVKLTPTKAGFARAAGHDVCAPLDDFNDATEVGVLCGPCPGAGDGARYVCVDYDGDVPAASRIGGTPTRTSKQGAHEWYRVPADVTGFRQTSNARKGPGWAVDTRDFGGYARETKNGELLWDNDLPPRDLLQSEVDALLGKRPKKAKKAPAPGGAVAVAGLESWDRASLEKLLAEPESTNDKAGHLGAMLAQHRWAEEEAQNYCEQVLAGQNTRHVLSAMAAFRAVRDGERGAWNGARRLQEYGLALLGESDIEKARPCELRRNEANQAQPWYVRGGEGAWLPAGEATAEAFVHSARPEINGLETAARNRRRADLLRDHRRYTMPDTDTDPWILNVRNGLIHLRTGELHPHDPQQYCTRTAGARYDDTLNTGRVEQLMLDWCDGEEDLAAYAWSLAGEAALGRGKRTFVICHGPTGTGKSCLTALIERTLGGYTASVSPETWLRGTAESERQEQLSRTIGARLVTSAEMPSGTRWHPVIKAFSSGGQDTVSVAGKYKSARAVKPHGLIWITGNDVPEGADSAMRARALFLPLTRTFPRNQLWADEVLPTYIPSALVKIVTCAAEAAARGGPLPMPERARTVQTERMAEPFVQWLEEHAAPGEQAKAHDLWLAWSRSKGEKDAPMTETALGRRMGDADLASEYLKNKTKNGAVYTGLRVDI